MERISLATLGNSKRRAVWGRMKQNSLRTARERHLQETNDERAEDNKPVKLTAKGGSREVEGGLRKSTKGPAGRGKKLGP